MLVYDWLWWGQLTNQNHARRCAEVHGEVCGGVWRCAEVHGGVRGGALRCAEGCMEVRGGVRGGVWRGVQRCTEVHRGVWRGAWRWWGKNQDFMLIRFLNAGV